MTVLPCRNFGGMGQGTREQQKFIFLHISGLLDQASRLPQCMCQPGLLVADTSSIS